MSQSLQKQKVLIVDDEERNQRIIVETLEDSYEQMLASSGEQALSHAETFKPDLVLLDIMMPGIDGYEVCRKIRANPDLHFTKVILVSGKAMLDERLKGYAAGADDYITETFRPRRVARKTRVFLRLTQMEKEMEEMNRDLDAKVHEKTRLLLEAESKMINSAKMSALGEMAGGVAHEINTPVATIILLSQQCQDLVGEEKMNVERLAKNLKVIQLTATHIGKIVKGLRSFSRDSVNDPFEMRSIKTIVSETMLLCGEKLKSTNLDVKVECPDVVVECQSYQIAQILLNLIGNARDAVEGTSEQWIRVEGTDFGREVEIRVSNSGPPIPLDVREKIFHPFFTTKGVGKGTGLGLSISKGIAEQHHGSLTLAEDCANTTFVLRIPKTQNRMEVA